LTTKSLFFSASLVVVLFAGKVNAQAPNIIEDYVKPPKLNWVFQTKGPIFSSAIVQDDMLHVASTDSTVYALDFRSGKLLHSFKTGGDIRSEMRLIGKSLAVVSGDGKLYLLNKDDLSLLWSFSSRGDKKYELYRFADYFQSSPLIHDNKIIFGSGDGYLYAVDFGKGDKIWEFKTGGVVHSDPVYAKGKIYFGSYDGYFYALDASSGKLVWKFKSVGQRYFPKGEMAGSPFAFEGTIYAAGRDYNIYALDAEQGHCVWNRQFPRGWALAPSVVDDGVLFVGTSDDRTLFALDPFTGEEFWHTPVAFNIFGAPAFTNSLVYVATLMGRLYALDKTSGAIRWSMDSEGYKKHHLDYFTKEDSYRPDIQRIITGEDGFLKMYYALGAIFSQPLICKEMLVLTSTNGKVYAYTRSN
jgi:outer membrane protein assembly factor BamB